MKTLYVSLWRPEEEILASSDSELRKNIRRGERRGLSLVLPSREDYEHVLKRWRGRKGLFTPKRTNWDENVLLAWAISDGKPVAGIGLFQTKFSSGLTEMGIFTERDPYFAWDWLRWQCMRWAKLHGAQLYDLAGFGDSSGIAHYKQKWGAVEGEDGRPPMVYSRFRFLRKFPPVDWFYRKLALVMSYV